MYKLVRELCTKYGKIDIFWFDALWVGGMFTAEMWDAEHLTRMIRELQPDVIINNRASIPGDFDTPEGHLGAYQDWRAWESCIPLSSGWNYTGQPAHSFEHLLHLIAGSACGDGNLLLSWGPHFDGAFDEEQKQRLFEIGDWLKLNGASIYGTRGGPWKPSNWGGSTRKGNKSFIHIYHTANNELIIPSIPRIKIVSAKLLESGEPVSFKQNANFISINIPKNTKIKGDLVIELTMDHSLDGVSAVNTEHICSFATDPSTYGKVIFSQSTWTDIDLMQLKEVTGIYIQRTSKVKQNGDLLKISVSSDGKKWEEIADIIDTEKSLEIKITEIIAGSKRPGHRIRYIRLSTPPKKQKIKLVEVWGK